MTVTLGVTSSLLGLIAAALCAVACWRLRDTTLAAPCAWAAASFFGLAAVETWSSLPPQSNTLLASHLNYLAGITVIAPFVALLGAKRPQNAAWQWIVLSLVGLLAFQDLRSWAIEGVAPSPHPAWRWLLAGIIVVQLVNYLLTRYFVAACLAFAGQICLLAGYLPCMPACPDWLFSAGATMLSLAIVMAGLISVRRRHSTDAWQAIWLDFRDRFGALWALRVCQRVNAIADAQQSTLRLSWYGLTPARSGAAGRLSTTPPAMSDRDSLHRALRSVLSRFVSAAWFACSSEDA